MLCLTGPEPLQRDGGETITEWYGRAAGVQQRSEGKALTETLAHEPQTVEICSSGGRGRLRLDSDDGAVAAFEDHVDLVPIAVTKVKGTRRIWGDARLTYDLHDYERLDQRPSDLRIGTNTLGVRAEQICQQAAIDNVQLRRLDEPAEQVRVPRGEAVKELSRSAIIIPLIRNNYTADPLPAPTTA